MKNYIETMVGFKATDKDMKCIGFQFELDKWYKINGDIKTCQKGFHFCEQLAGCFSYYNDMTSRYFKIEARNILVVDFEPGSNFKRVCKEIRLIEEIKYGEEGNRNTGYRNTGNSNTGDSNTGYSNFCNFSSGFFCSKDPKVVSFDIQTKLSREEFYKKYPENFNLSNALLQDDKIDFDKYKNIPGITKAKLKKLHKLFIDSRNKVNL